MFEGVGLAFWYLGFVKNQRGVQLFLARTYLYVHIRVWVFEDGPCAPTATKEHFRLRGEDVLSVIWCCV